MSLFRCEGPCYGSVIVEKHHAQRIAVLHKAYDPLQYLYGINSIL